MAELHAYQVGRPYIPGRTAWPEASEYNYRAGGHELRLFWRSPSEREVADVRRGEAEFALLTEGPVLFFLYRFGRSVSWSDAPFSIHLVPEAERSVPPTGPDEPNLLSIILVDAGSGIVLVLRAIGMELPFARALNQAIRDQAAAPWDESAYDAAHQTAYRRYPNPTNMVARAQARMLSAPSR